MVVKSSMFPFFAQDWDSFISPSLTEGRYPEGDDEVVVDQSFETMD